VDKYIDSRGAASGQQNKGEGEAGKRAGLHGDAMEL
jgi:hypothetical protein